MKNSRYTDSQILSILKQAEAGTPVPAPEHVTKVVATTIRSSDFLGDLGLLGFRGIRI